MLRTFGNITTEDEVHYYCKVLHTDVKNVMCIIFLTHYHTMTTLKHIGRKPSENIVEKGENANKQ